MGNRIKNNMGNQEASLKKSKKYLVRKGSVLLFLFISCLLFNIFIEDYLPIIYKKLIGGFLKTIKEEWRIAIFILLFISLSILFLIFLCFFKNKFAKEKSKYRFLLTLIFIIQLFYSVSFNVSLILAFINKYIIKIKADSLYSIYSGLFSFGVMLYLIWSLVENLTENDAWIFKFLFGSIFLITLLNKNNFQIVTLIIIVVNYYLSDMKYLYGNQSITSHSNSYSNIKTDEKIVRSRILINLSIIPLYAYLYFIDYLKSILLENDIIKSILTIIRSFFFEYAKEETIGLSVTINIYFFKALFIGVLRLIIFYFIYIGVISFYKKLFSEKYNSTFKSKLNKIMEKHIAIKYNIKVKNSNSGNTIREMESYMYIDCYLRSRRMFKYKELRLYKSCKCIFKFKKPNSN